MGHDHHFLSRLDRVNREETEFALGLYRDHELVRTLLEGLGIPEGVSRVAIALHDGADAPNIIVARDGHFVTCLGAGMSVKSHHPRVSRARVDATIARVTTLRERRRNFDEAPDGLAEALIAKTYRAGAGLTREDFAQLAAWQPLFEGRLLVSYMKMYGSVYDMAVRLARAVRGVRAPSDEQLHDYWNAIWAMGHVWMLATMGGHGSFEFVLKNDPRAFDDITLPLAMSGWLPLAMRGWWGGARLGATLLPSMVHKFKHAGDYPSIASAGQTLTAIALRHPGLATGIRATLTEGSPNVGKAQADLRQRSGQLGLLALDEPAEFTDYVTEVGHDVYRQQREWLETTAPRDPVEPTCSDDVARSLVATSMSEDPLRGTHGVTLATSTLPWLAEAAPEALYVPRAWLRHVGAWQRDEVLLMLARTRQFFSYRPVTVEKTPGRNDACTCGSGKKFKRCCGANA